MARFLTLPFLALAVLFLPPPAARAYSPLPWVKMPRELAGFT